MQKQELLDPKTEKGADGGIKSGCPSPTPLITPEIRNFSIISNALEGRGKASVSRPLSLHVVMRKGSTDSSLKERGRIGRIKPVS